MYRISQCLRREACGVCASCAAKVVGVSYGFEAFGAGWDAGRHARRCGAAQPAGLDCRCVRTAQSERPSTAAVQARQVSPIATPEIWQRL